MSDQTRNVYFGVQICLKNVIDTNKDIEDKKTLNEQKELDNFDEVRGLGSYLRTMMCRDIGSRRKSLTDNKSEKEHQLRRKVTLLLKMN